MIYCSRALKNFFNGSFTSGGICHCVCHVNDVSEYLEKVSLPGFYRRALAQRRVVFGGRAVYLSRCRPLPIPPSHIDPFAIARRMDTAIATAGFLWVRGSLVLSQALGPQVQGLRSDLGSGGEGNSIRSLRLGTRTRLLYLPGQTQHHLS